MFGTILISVCSVMHVYVFWRAAAVPLVRRHASSKTLILMGAILWTVFFLGRIIGHGGTGVLAGTLEFLGMNYMAALFLCFVCLLATDLVTLFGFLIPRLAPSLRGWALVVGAVLSVIALIQGLRPPVVQKYEVSVPALPADLDGTVLVALSDLHLGSQLGERWLAARIAQVTAQRPDIIIFLGDIFEGHGQPEDRLIGLFRRLSAPLGIWAVPGNHESHGGGGTDAMRKAGFTVLLNQWETICPGLVLAGIEDLTSLRRRGKTGDPMAKALAGRPPGATVLLSHTPWQAEKAAAAGVGLMLSGHTHGGQIWPFDYLVRSRYPLLEGRYARGGMSVIVCRGTGTWGPRMRLWRPGEMLRLTLRAKAER